MLGTCCHDYVQMRLAFSMLAVVIVLLLQFLQFCDVRRCESEDENMGGFDMRACACMWCVHVRLSVPALCNCVYGVCYACTVRVSISVRVFMYTY